MRQGITDFDGSTLLQRTVLSVMPDYDDLVDGLAGDLGSEAVRDLVSAVRAELEEGDQPNTEWRRYNTELWLVSMNGSVRLRATKMKIVAGSVCFCAQ